MTRLVGDLLFLASSDSGALPLDLELVDVALFLTRLADRAQILAQNHNNVFRADLRATGLAQIDGARIEQALLILVDNAGKYSPDGSEVALRSATRNGVLAVEVSDQGVGIPEEELPIVFERFYRVDKSRSRKQGGTGLGLPIAHSIVAAHGGHIEVQSQAGAGTLMRIHLPLIDVSPAPRTSAR